MTDDKTVTSSHDINAEHLKLLAIFHYVVAGLIGLLSLLPIIHIIIGILMFFGGLGAQQGQGAPPAIMGLFFACGAFFCAMLPGMVMAGAVATAGKKLQAREGHTFCTVVAAISCIFFPVGTVLGVFTLIVISKPEVKALFDQKDHQPIEVV